MAHYLFNVSKRDLAEGSTPRAHAVDRLRLRLWGIADDEPHRGELAPGDLTLIYLGAPVRAFLARAELASAVRDWTPTEATSYPGDASSGVQLAEIEEWDRPVPMTAVLRRIDPEGSNPSVQENARSGFRTGVVRITSHEYDSVLAVRAERSSSAG